LPILILIYFCIVKTKKENARKTRKYNTQRGKGREFSPRYRCFFGIYPPPRVDYQLVTTVLSVRTFLRNPNTTLQHSIRELGNPNATLKNSFPIVENPVSTLKHTFRMLGHPILTLKNSFPLPGDLIFARDSKGAKRSEGTRTNTSLIIKYF